MQDTLVGSNLKHKYVFIGESGSGKTENALNCAIDLSKALKKEIHFFDMDQTKGLFRARDFKETLEKQGIYVHKNNDFMDSPIVPQGVTGVLAQENTVCVFDVGGNTVGARMIGQYKHYFKKETTQIYYIINNYRPFTQKREDLENNMEQIILATGLSELPIRIISNPCLGKETTVKTILDGYNQLKRNLAMEKKEIYGVTVDRKLYDQVVHKLKTQVISLDIMIEYE